MDNDLISRSALIKAIFEHCRSETENINHFLYDENLIALIDNAPAVMPEITIEQAIAKIQETDLLSKHNKMLKEWADIKCEHCNKNVRPQGEWKETGYETGALGITYRQTQCSNCGWEHALPMWWNFCPNCGADMRGGET